MSSWAPSPRWRARTCFPASGICLYRFCVLTRLSFHWRSIFSETINLQLGSTFRCIHWMVRFPLLPVGTKNKHCQFSIHGKKVSHLLPRQPLWNFLKAGFPRTRYCIASATLTDAYVKDILSKGRYSVCISPDDHRVLEDIERGDGCLV